MKKDSLAVKIIAGIMAGLMIVPIIATAISFFIQHAH